MSLKNIKRVWFFDSVKGGSGKSSVCAKMYYEIKNQDKTPIVVDVDFLGTSWYFMFRDSTPGGLSNPRSEYIYLNNLIENWMGFQSRSKNLYIQSCDIFRLNGKREKIEFIMCHPDETAKRKYRVEDSSAHAPQISFSLFEHNIKKLIELLDNYKYTDILFDLPPNTEPYTDKLIHLFFDNKSFNIKSEYARLTRFFCQVTSPDASHIRSTFEYLFEFIYHNSSVKINRDSKNIEYCVFFNDAINLRAFTSPAPKDVSEVLLGMNEELKQLYPHETTDVEDFFSKHLKYKKGEDSQTKNNLYLVAYDEHWAKTRASQFFNSAVVSMSPLATIDLPNL